MKLRTEKFRTRGKPWVGVLALLLLTACGGDTQRSSETTPPSAGDTAQSAGSDALDNAESSADETEEALEGASQSVDPDPDTPQTGD